MTDLFAAVVDSAKFGPSFAQIRSHDSGEPARLMANEVFQNYYDKDGNFVEQFQTTGFDSRLFELYLFAYFARAGYNVDQSYNSPDFIIERDGLRVGVEATTVNPSALKDRVSLKDIADLTVEELIEKRDNEVPIRFGGPLFSKLQRRYWELPHLRDTPLVLAIESFHENGSLHFSDNAVAQFLYGLRHYPEWSEDGHLIVRSSRIDQHTWAGKTIPSNFFHQPGTEHISAVLFTNSATYPKFTRMGYIAGLHRGNLKVLRYGAAYDPNPDATEPLKFVYDLDDFPPPPVETWGQGVMVLHNPNALFPVPKGYFVDAADSYLEDGQLKADVPHFHPVTSETVNLYHEDDDASLEQLYARHSIRRLLKKDFDELAPARPPALASIAIEKGWVADGGKTILGVLLYDRTDKDWNYVVLGRDQQGVFRWIGGTSSISTPMEGRQQLLVKINEILDTGQKIFPQ